MKKTRMGKQQSIESKEGKERQRYMGKAKGPAAAESASGWGEWKTKALRGSWSRAARTLQRRSPKR